MRRRSLTRQARPWLWSGAAFALVFACESKAEPIAIYTIEQQRAAVAAVEGEWATADGLLHITVCEVAPPSPFLAVALSSHPPAPIVIRPFECNDTVSGCGVAHASCIEVPLSVPIAMDVTGDTPVAGNYRGVVSYGFARANSLNSPLTRVRTFSVQRSAVTLEGSYSAMNEITLDGFPFTESDAGPSDSALVRVGDAVCR